MNDTEENDSHNQEPMNIDKMGNTLSDTYENESNLNSMSNMNKF